ncbi:hypothetical protein NSQ54_01510 [Alkalihalobacillus sp. FSL W8-0930]
MKVYYEEMDGQLFPQWLLLPATSLHAPLSVQLDAPFERMEAEDFHDDITVVTVTQAALAIRAIDETHFVLHTDQVKNDLETHIPDSVDYYLIRLEDLEEVLQMNVKPYFSSPS